MEKKEHAEGLIFSIDIATHVQNERRTDTQINKQMKKADVTLKTNAKRVPPLTL